MRYGKYLGIASFIFLAACGSADQMDSIGSAELAVTDSSSTSILGIANNYNAMIFGDVDQTQNIGGGIAVGGNFKFKYGSYGQDQAGAAKIDVAGNLVGLDASIQGTVRYVGTNQNVRVGVNGSIQQVSDLGFDFAEEKALLSQRSATLGTSENTGTVVIQSWGAIEITATGGGLKIVTLTAAQLASTNTINIASDATTTLVINVKGGAISLGSFGLNKGAMADSHLLWNFPDATSLKIQGTSWKGSILAPLAALELKNMNATGTVVGNSLVGALQLNHAPFTGELPPIYFDPPPTDPPVLSLNLTPQLSRIGLGQSVAFNASVETDQAPPSGCDITYTWSKAYDKASATGASYTATFDYKNLEVVCVTAGSTCGSTPVTRCSIVESGTPELSGMCGDGQLDMYAKIYEGEAAWIDLRNRPIDDTVFVAAEHDGFPAGLSKLYINSYTRSGEVIGLLSASVDHCIVGGDGDDTLLGGLGNDFLDGGEGNDFLHSIGGTNYMFGGNGDDHLVGHGGTNYVDAGEGNDIFFGHQSTNYVDGGPGDDILIGGDNFDALYGGDGNDELYGGLSHDYLSGDYGDDKLCGAIAYQPLADDTYAPGGDNNICYLGANTEIEEGTGSCTPIPLEPDCVAPNITPTLLGVPGTL